MTDEQAAYGAAVLGALATTYAVVPAIWPFEIANTLVVAERRRRVTQEQMDSYFDLLRSLSIYVERRESVWICQAAIALARKHRLTAYDAAYLDLAHREGLRLATLDQNLREAARELGVFTAEF